MIRYFIVTVLVLMSASAHSQQTEKAYYCSCDIWPGLGKTNFIASDKNCTKAIHAQVKVPSFSLGISQQPRKAGAQYAENCKKNVVSREIRFGADSEFVNSVQDKKIESLLKTIQEQAARIERLEKLLK